VKTALIVLDLINDIVDVNGKVGGTTVAIEARSRNIIDKASTAMEIARRKGWLVVLVKVGFASNYHEQPKHSPFFGKAHEFRALELEQWGTEFHPELRIAKSDFVVTKSRVSAFYNTSLEPLLRAQGIERVVLLGVSTTWAVEAAARDAHDRDYRVVRRAGRRQCRARRATTSGFDQASFRHCRNRYCLAVGKYVREGQRVDARTGRARFGMVSA
jgi:nicotinamidase-related amidase